MPSSDRKSEPRIRAKFTMLPAKGPSEPHEDVGKVGLGVVVPAMIAIFGDTDEPRATPAASSTSPTESHPETISG